MKQFKIEDKEFTTITEWNELTVKQYLEIATVQQNKDSFFIDELFMMRLLEVLCNVNEGDLDDMPLELLPELTSYIEMLKVKPVWSNVTHFELDGVIYVLMKDLNKVTTGEYISLKTIEAKYKNDPIGMIGNMLAILVRPGKVVADPETGKESYEIEKFSSKNMEFRSKLLLEKGKAVDLVGMVDFFLTGNGLYSTNTQSSSQVTPEMEDMKLEHQ